jgi:hypothetical protein
MAELPDNGLPLFKVLCAAPVAWQTPAEVANALGSDPEAVLDLLSELDAAGWIAVWETDDGPLVTLSALAAERLHVRIVEIGFGQKPRWAPVGEPEPPEPRSRGVFLGDQPAVAHLARAAERPPDQILEQSERPKRTTPGPKISGRKEDPARPTVLVGLGLSPWPSPAPENKALCPACGGRMLRPHMYCIYCDRSGADVPPQDPGTAVPTHVARRLPNDDRIRAARAAEHARLRERRKAKHARRQHAKVQNQLGREREPESGGPGARPGPPPGNINLGFAAPPAGPLRPSFEKAPS